MPGNLPICLEDIPALEASVLVRKLFGYFNGGSTSDSKDPRLTSTASKIPKDANKYSIPHGYRNKYGLNSL